MANRQHKPKFAYNITMAIDIVGDSKDLRIELRIMVSGINGINKAYEEECTQSSLYIMATKPHKMVILDFFCSKKKERTIWNSVRKSTGTFTLFTL